MTKQVHPRSQDPAPFGRCAGLRYVVRVAPALLLLLAVSSPVPAQAADPLLRSFNDTSAVPSPAEATAELLGMRQYVCPRGGARPTGGLTKARAIASAKRFLARGGRAGAYRRFLGSKYARSAKEAEILGVGAVAGKAPATALAAFLVAHDRDQGNPRHLISASVALTRLGMPQEALALAKAAERMKRPNRAPMGIGLRALALNSQGLALITLRRYADAERPLAAAAREPLLSEADLNLAHARLCRGRIQQAVGPYIAGKRRNVFSGEVTIAETTRTFRSQPRAGSSLDLSQGIEGRLPTMRLPATPDDAVATAPGFKATNDRRYNEATALYERTGTALNDWSANLPTKPLLQQRRSSEILDLFNRRYEQRPDLKAQKDAFVATPDRFLQHQSTWFNAYIQNRNACVDAGGFSAQVRQCIRNYCVPATATAHNAWLPLMREADGYVRAWAGENHRYASALAANLANPVAQKLLMESVRHEIMSIYASHVTLPAFSWTQSVELAKDDCTNAGGTAGGEDGEADLRSPDLCSPQLATIKFKVAFGEWAEASINCEEVGFEVAALIYAGVLGPFAQVGYKFRSGTTTVFAGAKAGITPIGISADGKAGIYLSFDSQGTLTDTGLRGGVAADTGSGAVLTVVDKSWDYSLADSLL